MFREAYHGSLVGGAGNSHTTAGALRLLGELHVHLAVILRHQAVVEVVVLDFEEDGFTIHVVARLQEVHNFGGDEDAVAVDGLHSDEAGVETQRSQLCEAAITHSHTNN